MVFNGFRCIRMDRALMVPIRRFTGRNGGGTYVRARIARSRFSFVHRTVRSS